MSEVKNVNPDMNNGDQLSLDDGRRVKVLSPGMMVFKRFIRNRLAIVGICILVFMFTFSFLGGVLSPYRQDQVFYKIDSANKEYAGAVVNSDYRFTTVDGSTLSTMVRATFNSQVKGKEGDTIDFTADKKAYTAVKLADNFYVITCGEEVYAIEDKYNTWDEFAGPGVSDLVKADIALRVKLFFDPPSNSFLVDSLNKQINEYEFRMLVQADEEIS